MRAAAAGQGIDLVPVSTFRDFTRQLAIWNSKCRGQRELRDRDGSLLDFSALDADALVTAILHWSALPGASRHHWGTELDFVDAAAQPVDAAQLVTGEYAPGGVYARLNGWLDANAGRFGFYRPYATDRGGYQPEPWHLSYAPVARWAQAALTLALLREALADAALEAKEAVLRRLPELHQRYVVNVDPPPPALDQFSPGSRPS
jgi:LAS superfamily LD-carboxypeptidase LdcB